jgi:hypothetical protein
MKIIITEKQSKKLYSQTIKCEKCEHEWVFENNDKHPDLCHTCGWDNKEKKYDDKELFNFWKNKTLDEKWSKKYKSSIDCNNPKGFSQKAHCQGKKKKD